MLDSDLINVQTGVDFFSDKEVFLEEFPKIVYTGMIDQFFDYSFGELEYRSVRFETETVKSDNIQGNAVINYTDAETPYTRVMEWRHFDKKADEGYTILTKEFPQNWDRTKEAYYPVNDEKNSKLFRKYKEETKKYPNVIFGGRLGNYQYYDMDQVFGVALKAVEKEFKGYK
ncbi:UDP-galactopyranose mutase [Lactococcus lactis subsp. lactis]|nr:UDP-galactopyranose mutase [Lactococcus lactis subsp. lactis]